MVKGCIDIIMFEILLDTAFSYGRALIVLRLSSANLVKNLPREKCGLNLI